MTMLHRDFWSAGFPVFGLFPIIEGGRCACGNPDCKAVGKHPRPKSWQNTQLISDEDLDAAERKGALGTGYGVLCKGLLVVDVDARNGGIASYESLRRKVPSIDEAGLIVLTGSGSGSRHLYFKLPEDLELVQGHPDYPGIEFKTSGLPRRSRLAPQVRRTL